MTKEEYKKELIEIQENIHQLNVRKIKIYEEYLSEHREYKDGDKVRLINNNSSIEAFISGCRIHDNGELYYKFKRSKKDGSPSKIRLNSWELDYDFQIELIESVKL